MKNKRIVSLLVVMLAMVMLLGTFSSYAIEPYQTYTYSSDGFALYSPAAYATPQTFNYSDVFAADMATAVSQLSCITVEF